MSVVNLELIGNKNDKMGIHVLVLILLQNLNMQNVISTSSES